MLKLVFLALFLLVIVVFGKDAPPQGPSESRASSKPTRKQDRNGCFIFRACGKDGVLQSQPIDSINDKGKPVRNHACQCKDGRLMLVNWRGTAVAPDGAGTATIIVTQPDGTKIEIDPKDWALSLKQFPACQDIVPESLSADGVQPAECASNLVMGSTCTEGCAATLKALGQECYSAAKYVIANPEIIKLSPEELFNNCVNGKPYGGVQPTDDDKETETEEEKDTKVEEEQQQQPEDTKVEEEQQQQPEDTKVEEEQQQQPEELEEEITNEKEEDTKISVIPATIDTQSSATKVMGAIMVAAVLMVV